MSIASHCADLIRDRGPLTAEELGQACREAGLSRASKPAVSVAGALSYDGRVLRFGDRYHLVTSLLDSRWLTFRRPATSKPFPHELDLAPLSGPAGRHDIPVRGGGLLARTMQSGWTTVTCELPDAEIIGMRLVGGTAELTAVEIDDAARGRGDRLAGLVRGSIARQVICPSSRDIAKAILSLVHEDKDVLRDPVPPLSDLFPELLPKPRAATPTRPVPPAQPRAPREVVLVLPDEVHESLAEEARHCGESVGEWLSTEVTRLARWPHAARWDAERGHDWYPDDEAELEADVLRFPRW
jgi:hypothetical protein